MAGPTRGCSGLRPAIPLPERWVFVRDFLRTAFAFGGIGSNDGPLVRSPSLDRVGARQRVRQSTTDESPRPADQPRHAITPSQTNIPAITSHTTRSGNRRFCLPTPRIVHHNLDGSGTASGRGPVAGSDIRYTCGVIECPPRCRNCEPRPILGVCPGAGGHTKCDPSRRSFPSLDEFAIGRRTITGPAVIRGSGSIPKAGRAREASGRIRRVGFGSWGSNRIRSNRQRPGGRRKASAASGSVRPVSLRQIVQSIRLHFRTVQKYIRVEELPGVAFGP
jgi:hypothetical protein